MNVYSFLKLLAKKIKFKYNIIDVILVLMKNCYSEIQERGLNYRLRSLLHVYLERLLTLLVISTLGAIKKCKAVFDKL